MFAVCSLLFSIALLFSVLEARMVASRKRLWGSSDMGDRDENTYSDDEIDLVVNSAELLKNFRQKKGPKLRRKHSWPPEIVHDKLISSVMIII